MTAPAVVRLDRKRADRLTARLAGAADLMLDLVVEAYEGEVWKVYGLASWSDYTAAKVPQLAIIGKGLPVEQRRDAVELLRGRGLSLRGIADVLGIGSSTVKRDGEARGLRLVASTRRDGRVRTIGAAPAKRPARVHRVDPIVSRVRAAGADGLTVRDLVADLRWSQHVVSAALTRLSARGGPLVYCRPERRGQFGRYVAG